MQAHWVSAAVQAYKAHRGALRKKKFRQDSNQQDSKQVQQELDQLKEHRSTFIKVFTATAEHLVLQQDRHIPYFDIITTAKEEAKATVTSTMSFGNGNNNNNSNGNNVPPFGSPSFGSPSPLYNGTPAEPPAPMLSPYNPNPRYPSPQWPMLPEAISNSEPQVIIAFMNAATPFMNAATLNEAAQGLNNTAQGLNNIVGQVTNGTPGTPGTPAQLGGALGGALTNGTPAPTPTPARVQLGGVSANATPAATSPESSQGQKGSPAGTLAFVPAFSMGKSPKKKSPQKSPRRSSPAFPPPMDVASDVAEANPPVPPVPLDVVKVDGWEQYLKSGTPFDSLLIGVIEEAIRLCEQEKKEEEARTLLLRFFAWGWTRCNSGLVAAFYMKDKAKLILLARAMVFFNIPTDNAQVSMGHLGAMVDSYISKFPVGTVVWYRKVDDNFVFMGYHDVTFAGWNEATKYCSIKSVDDDGKEHFDHGVDISFLELK